MGPEMDFLRSLPRDFKDNLGKQRKYTGNPFQDPLPAWLLIPGKAVRPREDRGAQTRSGQTLCRKPLAT
jgi:hypothetical protein